MFMSKRLPTQPYIRLLPPIFPGSPYNIVLSLAFIFDESYFIQCRSELSERLESRDSNLLLEEVLLKHHTQVLAVVLKVLRNRVIIHVCRFLFHVH